MPEREGNNESLGGFVRRARKGQAGGRTIKIPIRENLEGYLRKEFDPRSS